MTRRERLVQLENERYRRLNNGEPMSALKPLNDKIRELARYSIIAYSFDCGADEKPEACTYKEALEFAKYWLNNKEGQWDGVCIWDFKLKVIKDVFGEFPESALPKN